MPNPDTKELDNLWIDKWKKYLEKVDTVLKIDDESIIHLNLDYGQKFNGMILVMVSEYKKIGDTLYKEIEKKEIYLQLFHPIFNTPTINIPLGFVRHNHDAVRFFQTRSFGEAKAWILDYIDGTKDIIEILEKRIQQNELDKFSLDSLLEGVEINLTITDKLRDIWYNFIELGGIRVKTAEIVNKSGASKPTVLRLMQELKQLGKVKLEYEDLWTVTDDNFTRR